jgi:hypothetical protein
MYNWAIKLENQTAPSGIPGSHERQCSQYGREIIRLQPADRKSLFQWMLRQGDTTLVGGGSTDTVFTANAGPDRTIYYPQDSIHVVGSGVDSAGTITGYAWATVSGTGATIVSPDSASTAITGLSTGNYSFSLTLTDSRGRMVSDTMLVHVGDTSFKGETHNFITYDTTINYVCLPGYNGCTVGGVQEYFTLRISRPVNYFTPGNADTASRPLILTMPTDSAETDTSYLTQYGPHYWLKNGWDGSVTLENGKHYPLLITVIGSTANIRPFQRATADGYIDQIFPSPRPLDPSHGNDKRFHQSGLVSLVPGDGR